MVADGAQISAATGSEGAAGNLTLNATRCSGNEGNQLVMTVPTANPLFSEPKSGLLKRMGQLNGW